VDAYALMGSVHVTVGDGQVVRAGPEAVPVPHRVAPEHREGLRSHYGRPVPAHRPGLMTRLRRRSGLLVPLAVLGGVLVAGADSASIFGSSETVVSAEAARDGADVAVSTLFGSVTVIVPEGVRVATSGLVVFGSTECAACGVAVPEDAPVVTVRAIGGFGSVEVLTVDQAAEREQEPDAEED
jgi:hypothetical protein